MAKGKFLCVACKYGCFSRVVKDANGIAVDVEWLCKCEQEAFSGGSILDLPNGPGGWDGESCANYVERKVNSHGIALVGNLFKE